MTSARKVLVIATHPDDEVLGCGGTVALHVRNGDLVTSVIVCEGASVRFAGAAEQHAAQAQKAAAELGVRDCRMLGFPDQRLESLELTTIISALETIVGEVEPQIVYCQFGGDVNRDHKIVFEATLVATRPTVAGLSGVFAFDTASSTEWGYPRCFVPDTWVDISSTLEIKLAAVAAYQTELCDWPHPRSVRGLISKAESYGVQALMAAAEPFVTIRRHYRAGQTPV